MTISTTSSGTTAEIIVQIKFHNSVHCSEVLGCNTGTAGRQLWVQNQTS